MLDFYKIVAKKRTFILSSLCLLRPNFHSSKSKTDHVPTSSILRVPTKHQGRPDNEVEMLETSLKQAEKTSLFGISAQESTNYSRER